MRKSTKKLFLYGMMGALFGGIIIVLVLSMIGAGNRVVVEERTVKQNTSSTALTILPSPPSITVAPSSVATTGNTINPKNTMNNFLSGKFSYSVPAGYRVATKIIAMDEKNALAGFSTLTLTQGSEQQENDYVKLIEQLQGYRDVPPVIDVPQFLPGQTITVYNTSKNAQESDAKLSKGQEKLTTVQGISGTRYIRVEGSTPYDVVYLKLSDDRLIAVQMSYGSEEPLFDEVAYLAVINSIKL